MDASPPEESEPTASAPSHEIAAPAPPKAFAETEQKAKPKIEIDAERIRTSIARLTSNSIGELEGLASELQKLDEFIKYETERIQRDIDSLLSGIKIIVETISPWKRSATITSPPVGPARAVFAASRGRDDPRRNPANA
ncbi:MAG TPA: hypothetical protein VMA30_04210 [Xanthobacteraceae bacterium]|nr:hypothetical protein [Xanthobacteraceae bacterium]